jgi:hypothetical protein
LQGSLTDTLGTSRRAFGLTGWGTPLPDLPPQHVAPSVLFPATAGPPSGRGKHPIPPGSKVRQPKPVNSNDGTGVWNPVATSNGVDHTWWGPSQTPVDHSNPSLNSDQAPNPNIPITAVGTSNNVLNGLTADNASLPGPGGFGGGDTSGSGTGFGLSDGSGGAVSDERPKLRPRRMLTK